MLLTKRLFSLWVASTKLEEPSFAPSCPAGRNGAGLGSHGSCLTLTVAADACLLFAGMADVSGVPAAVDVVFVADTPGKRSVAATATASSLFEFAAVAFAVVCCSLGAFAEGSSALLSYAFASVASAGSSLSFAASAVVSACSALALAAAVVCCPDSVAVAVGDVSAGSTFASFAGVCADVAAAAADIGCVVNVADGCSAGSSLSFAASAVVSACSALALAAAVVCCPDSVAVAVGVVSASSTFAGVCVDVLAAAAAVDVPAAAAAAAAGADVADSVADVSAGVCTDVSAAVAAVGADADAVLVVAESGLQMSPFSGAVAVASSCLLVSACGGVTGAA